MNDNDPRTEPLREWNRLARENTENAIVSSMFEASFNASEPLETFSTWLLVGSAAIASFFVTNADKLVPFIKQSGFLTCGAFLCLSCLMGLVSRVYALRCKIGIAAGSAVRKTFAEHLSKYQAEETAIKKSAGDWGVTLETGIRMDRVFREFLSPLPRWVGWLVMRHLNKHANNPQVGYLMVIRMMQRQGLSAALQAVSFFGFLIAGFGFAAAA